MPQKYNVHRIVTWLAHRRAAWALRAPMYGNQFWQYVDIDDGNGDRWRRSEAAPLARTP